MTPTTDKSSAPECQVRNCEADAATSREHPEFGPVQVCRNCASLWGGDEG